MPKKKGRSTKNSRAQKSRKQAENGSRGSKRSRPDKRIERSQNYSKHRHGKMTMLQELQFTDRHRLQDLSRSLRHGQILFVKATQNYDPSHFINEYLKKRSRGEDSSLAGLVTGELDPGMSLKLSSAAASSEDNGELSVENESGTDSMRERDGESLSSCEYDKQGVEIDDSIQESIEESIKEEEGDDEYKDEDEDENDNQTITCEDYGAEIFSEYGKGGIADDERGDSDNESDTQFRSISHSASNMDDDYECSDDIGNHSSDVNYDELIGLKHLALRDLEGGSDVNFGSNDSSDSTDDEFALDEEDTYDSDDVDFDTEYDSILDEISEIKSITRTITGPDGKIFTLSLVGDDDDISVTESQLYAYFKRHRGLSRSEMTKSIAELGGDLESFDSDYNDLCDEPSNRRLATHKSGPQYDEDMERILDNSNLQDEELDSIIQALIEGDGQALEQQASSSLSSIKRSKKPPQFDLSDDELQDYLNSQWQKSREAKRAKRREREQLHKRGLFKGPKGDIGRHHIDLRREYLERMHINEIVAEFQKFLISPFAQQMIFPPMDNHGRWTIKELAKAFKVAAISTEAKGVQKHVVITKNASSNLSNVDSVVVSKIQNRRRMFPRADLTKPIAARSVKSRQSNGTKHHREGEVVGSEASEIGIDNVGRQLLEKMGWKAGMGLGTTTIGILEPISAVVKRTKWGLGKEKQNVG